MTRAWVDEARSPCIIVATGEVCWLHKQPSEEQIIAFYRYLLSRYGDDYNRDDRRVRAVNGCMYEDWGRKGGCQQNNWPSRRAKSQRSNKENNNND